MLETLPDYPQAKHLAAVLWRREEQARGAALIVGAGVSTMAQTASENTPKPPLWRDLAKSLSDRLYPNNPEWAPADALKLAQEFQSYFGQAALNAHLREQIPDNAWFPSPTHKRLLQLPWADVLTTNYDTLLERAAAEILTPAYDFVKSAADLVHARQPRIVKLHGSIGDDSPLVLTEEDYRTYPNRNAAMVNLARQVFIENELCLLGFSGDDPNFLQWAGWVRDHLQGSHRKIYLVGVLRLSPSARRLLEERNIAPIDLAPLIENRSKSEQHAAATALLLEFFEQSKPAPVYEWALSDRQLSAFVGADTQAERDRLAALERLRIRTIRWREDRLRYPGWVICPREYRSSLASSCLASSKDMCIALDSLQASESASFLTEFVWRCRTALCSPDDEQKKLLEKYLQWNGLNSLAFSQIECALMLLSNYRNVGDLAKFGELDAQLQKSELNADQRAYLSYEQALYARDLMRLEDLRTLLETIEGEDPMWKLRRAALACDLNMWDCARQQWLNATADIRRREQADRQSIWVRSRRALLDFVLILDWESREKGSYADSRVRSIQDRVSHCDPWEYVEEAREAIQRVHDERQRVRDETRELTFNPGIFRNRKIYSGSIAGARELRREIQRWTDWAGIPNRFKKSSLPPLGIESLALVPEPSLSWVLLMIRGILGSRGEYLNRNFTRLSIAKLPRSVLNETSSILLSACEFWRRRITRESEDDASRSAQETLGDVMSVLGRFIIAADIEIVQRSLDFAFDLAVTNRDIEWNQYEALGDLLEGSIRALPSHSATLALRCASMPLASELTEKTMTHLWPEPAQWLTNLEAASEVETSLASKGRIEHLLKNSRFPGAQRVQVLTRLNALLQLGLLSPDQKVAFGDALWSSLDEGKPPLPWPIPFRIRTLRDLPAPISIDVVSLLRERLFTVQKYFRPSDQVIRDMISVATGPDPLLPDPASATALLDDYLDLPPRLRGWLKGSLNEQPYQVQPRRDWLGLMIGRALVPAIDFADLTIERLGKILNLMDETNSESAATALPYFAAAQPNEVSQIFYRIQAALLGGADGDVASGAEAIRTWLSKDNLRICLSQGQISQFHELLMTALTASSSQSEPDLIKTAHLVLFKNIDPAHASRLAKVTQLLLRRTQPDLVQPGGDGEAHFSLVRAEVLRMAKSLLDVGIKNEEIQAAISASSFDPLPEIRFALAS